MVYKSDLCTTASDRKNDLDQDGLIACHKSWATRQPNPIHTTPHAPRKIHAEGHDNIEMSDDGALDVAADGNSPTPTADTPILPTAIPCIAPPPLAAPSAPTDPNSTLLAMMVVLLKRELAPVLDRITVVETHTKALGWTSVQYDPQPGDYPHNGYYDDIDFEAHNAKVAPIEAARKLALEADCCRPHHLRWSDVASTTGR